MLPDPTAEIKRIRHELGAQDDFDVAKIFARLRRCEAESVRTSSTCAPRSRTDANGPNADREIGDAGVTNRSSQLDER